jgi:dolichol kinase
VSELRREFGRKAFHMLSLVYLAAFLWLGWPAALRVGLAWLAVVTLIETARLKLPAAERALVSFFEGMIRDTERRAFSGIFHTTAGCVAAMLIARGEPVIVSAAILQLALADAASALTGKAFGRVRLFGGRKTLEGSLAGFAVGYAAAAACGVRPGAALAAAAAASLVELAPTTAWFNDNLWIPVASATTLALLGAA